MSLDESRGTAIEVGSSGRSRLFRGQTAIDFYGRRRLGLMVSLGLLVLTLGSLGLRGLDLGIDFEGAVCRGTFPRPRSESTKRRRSSTRRACRPMVLAYPTPLLGIRVSS